MNALGKVSAAVATAAAATVGTVLYVSDDAGTTSIDQEVNTRNAVVEIWEPQLVDLGIVDISADLVDVTAGQIKTYQPPAAPIDLDTYVPTVLHSMEGDVLDIAVVGISSSVLDLHKNAEAVRKVANMFMDTRNASFNNTMLNEADILNAWYDVYHAEAKLIDKVALPSGIRMVAEVRIPEDGEQYNTLIENLEHYKGLGYTSALLVFDTQEPLSALKSTIKLIRAHDLGVWFAFAGATSKVDGMTYLEDTKSVFPDPQLLKKYLVELAPLCDGFIGMWKRTSAHFFVQDQPYMDYIASCVREGNPNIPVLGEIYFGPTADVPEVDGIKKMKSGTNQFNYLIPRKANNASGYLVVNLGYSNVNVKGVMNGLLSGQKEDDKLVLISGPNPVFISTGRPTLTYKQLRQVYTGLEKRWLNVGAKGVVLLHGEMSDGNAANKISNNLSVSRYFDK